MSNKKFITFIMGMDVLLLAGVLGLFGGKDALRSPNLFSHLSRCTVTVKTERGQGSGFVLYEHPNLVITCAHVVEDTMDISIIDNQGKSFKINPHEVYVDVDRDVAILPLYKHQWSTGLKLGKVHVGNVVFICGTPLNDILQNTITMGIIGGVRSELFPDNLIQVDGAIHPGNSGGPIVNRFGRLVGMSQSVWRGAHSIGFGVHVDEIKKVLEEYMEWL